MTQLVAEFSWSLNFPVVSWSFCGQRVVKSYSNPILSANVLHDGSGVAVVEPFKISESSDPNRHNAVIFNADGTERARVEFPIPEVRVYWFNDMYYVKDELTAMLATTGNDLAVVVDELTGRPLRSYETR